MYMRKHAVLAVLSRVPGTQTQPPVVALALTLQLPAATHWALRRLANGMKPLHAAHWAALPPGDTVLPVHSVHALLAALGCDPGAHPQPLVDAIALVPQLAAATQRDLRRLAYGVAPLHALHLAAAPPPADAVLPVHTVQDVLATLGCKPAAQAQPPAVATAFAPQAAAATQRVF